MNDLLKTIAPLLGTALGGPLGGAAAAFIADKLGLDSKTVKNVSEVLNGSKMDPAQIAQIKLAEIEFQKFCKQHEIDTTKLDMDNTKDARDMQKQTRSFTPSVLTYLITIGFFGILGYMMTSDYKASDPLLVMLGSLGTAWTACVSFWFGSSYGSAQKTALLAQADAVKLGGTTNGGA